MSNKEIRTSPCKVLGIIFLIILILSTVFVALVHIVFKNENVTPSIGGYSLYIMREDYMEPTIKKNALVLATNGKPSPDDINKGRVIIANDVSGNNGITYGTTAMLFVGFENQDQLYYQVKFESSPDIISVKGDKIEGIAEYKFEYIGPIIVLAGTILGYFIFIGIPALLMIIFLALGKHSKTKQLAAIEQKRLEELAKPVENTNDKPQPSFDEFIREKEGPHNIHQEEKEDQVTTELLSDVKDSEILNEPLIEEGINKDDLVEMKEDLVKPKNSAIEELMKILEEENSKLKDLELPKAEKAVEDFQKKTISDTDSDPLNNSER